MENQEFADLLAKQEVLAKQLEAKRIGYKKEPKRRLRDIERLKGWHDSIQAIWIELDEGNNQLLEHEDQLHATEYFTENRFAKSKLYYNDMVHNIRFMIGLCEINAVPAEASSSDTGNENNADENMEPIEINDEEAIESDDSNDEFKTPRATNRRVTYEEQDEFKTPRASIRRMANRKYPDFVTKNSELRKKVETTIDRFSYKLKSFARELDIIDDYIKNNLKSTAKSAILDIEKKRNDLSDCMEEIGFMIGDDASDYEATYESLIFRYRELKTEVQRKEKADVQPMTLKLKPIEIPTFTGTFKTWPTFSGLFKTLIIKNGALDNIQKMQYLKTNVSGEAAKLISNIDVTADNFDIAWKLLIERFENKRAIRDTHLELLLKLPDMKFENSGDLQEYYDKSKECIELLKDMSGEQILLYLLMKKLPNETRKIYEQSRENPTEEQKLSEYFEFLHKRCRVLETIEGNSKKYEKKYNGGNYNANEKKFDFEKCACCNEKHPIFICTKFKSITVNERRDLVKQKALCLLCLKPKHQANECKFKKMCPHCNKRHNGLLHFNENEKSNRKFEKNTAKDASKKAYVATSEVKQVVCATAHDNNDINTLLATAIIRVKTLDGHSETLRALIDHGSMSSFVTERAVKKLNLKQTKNKINICGIAGSVEESNGTVEMQITARYPTSFKTNVTAIVLKKLTTLLPGTDFDKTILNNAELDEYMLADPEFNKQARIDMILGADVYADLILDGLVKADNNAYILQETEIGWIISGPLTNASKNRTICMTATVNEMDEKLQRFWELEEIGNENSLKPEEQQCIEHFNETLHRDDDGAYIVSLPFKKDASQLGDSRRMAIAQFFQLEKKFKHNPELKRAYEDYIKSLIERGWLKKCIYDKSKPHCYLPHHPVTKESTTTKVRPVFDASRKTSNGRSLNDLLITGPRLQEDLFNILVRFRSHAIAFTADIEKMYLHVKLRENEQRFQMMIWRDDENKPLEDYCLTTVTFGVNSSPFLAVAAVQEHAKRKMSEYPEACQIIMKDSYMDDISSGCNELEDAIKIRENLTQVLAEADFPLRKWVSNSDELLATIPDEQKEETKKMNGHKYASILGLRWFCEIDKLGFNFTASPLKKLTKRAILSHITTIFDPLGLLSPITIYNKILMQEIWRENTGWDDNVSQNIEKKWMAFQQQADIIEKIKTKRWLNYIPGMKTELHGFSDASEAAMGACVYIKTSYNGEIHTNLVAAKTKVAPNHRVTLPRLELCAAVLLAKLMKIVKKSLNFENIKTYLYSDSEITLAWIKGDPNRWKTFVANRVSRILENSDPKEWRYINTTANPADHASRGLLPKQLIENKLWWEGPSILLNENDADSIEISHFKTDLEEKKSKTNALHLKIDVDAINRFSV